jgi:putative Holliday junction resolvase
LSRILSIDLGERRVGLAISDEQQIIAQSLDTINFKDEHVLITKIKQIVEDRMISEIVLGNPISLSGNKTKRSVWVEDFQSKLEKELNIPINLFDERFTSQLATRILEQADRSTRSLKKHVKAKSYKGQIDKLAATIILEDYLTYKKRNI